MNQSHERGRVDRLLGVDPIKLLRLLMRWQRTVIKQADSARPVVLRRAQCSMRERLVAELGGLNQIGDGLRGRDFRCLGNFEDRLSILWL